MKTFKSFKALTVGLAGAITAFSVAAHDVKPFNLEESVEKAGLIFEGAVLNVEHRSSDVTSPEHVALPHTFITYSADKVLKGDFDKSTITLRFIGGQDEVTGDFLSVEGVPFFNIDEEDVLFVSNNGESMCPLQGCEKGRFRVVGENVYSQHGSKVFLDEKGTVKFGGMAPAEDLEQLRFQELPLAFKDQHTAKEQQMIKEGKFPFPDMIMQDDMTAPKDGETEVLKPRLENRLPLFTPRRSVSTAQVVENGNGSVEKQLPDAATEHLGQRLTPKGLVEVIQAKVEELKLMMTKF